jgi:hypothetical protein
VLKLHREHLSNPAVVHVAGVIVLLCPNAEPLVMLHRVHLDAAVQVAAEKL